MRKLSLVILVVLFGTFFFSSKLNAQKIFNNRGDSVSLSFENIICEKCLDLLLRVQTFQTNNILIFEEVVLEPGVIFGAQVLLNQFNEVDSICSAWISVSGEKRNLFTNFLSNSTVNSFFVSSEMRKDPMLKENLSRLLFAVNVQKNKDIPPR